MTRNTIAFLLGCALIVTTRAAADTKTWTGAVDHLWSVGGNWAGGVAPVSGDSLVFPSGAANPIMSNDLMGLSLQTITITGSGYTCNGNSIGLAGGKSSPSCCVNTIWNLPTTLTAAQTFLDNGTVEYTNVIDLRGHALTFRPSATTFSGLIVGSGSVDVTGGGLHFTGTSAFAGVFNVSGRLNVAGTIRTPLVIASNGRLSGNGTVGALALHGTLSPGNDPSAGCCGEPGVPGILTTGNLEMDGGTMRFDALSATPGSGHDQIVAGKVILRTDKPQLQFVPPAAPPTPGQSFTLIRDQSGTSIVGFFSSLNDRAHFTAGGVLFRITYGSDVVVTPVVPTTTTAMSSKSPALSGEQVTWTAHVTSPHGSPVGGVRFFEPRITVFVDPRDYGGATLVDGKASITVTVGGRRPFASGTVIAQFRGQGLFADSSATFSQGLTPAPSAVNINLSASSIVLGQPVIARVEVLGGVMSQDETNLVQVTLFIDGQPFATRRVIPLHGASFELPPLAVGTHVITATHPGDIDRLPGTSAPAILTVSSPVTIPTLGLTALVFLAIGLAVLGSRFLLR